MQLDSARSEIWDQSQWRASISFYPKWIGNRIVEYNRYDYAINGVQEKVMLAYNANGNPITRNRLIWGLNGYVGNVPGAYKIRYYYEPYSSVSTTDIEKRNRQITLFPNPATSSFHIELNKSEIASIDIYNMRGQKVMQQFTNHSTIHIAHLTKGQYIVKVKDVLGRSYSQSIIKK